MTVSQPHRQISHWVQLIRAEYLEIPGLSLTKRQAQLLWGLDDITAETILAVLIDIGFLKRTVRDTYVRSDTG